jgi:hypothetical protein
MTHPKLNAFLIIIGVVVAVLFAQPWIEQLRHRDQLSARHGKLVDANSGAPVVDAYVVYQFTQNPDACWIDRITRSDANGEFSFPGVSSEFTFSRTWAINIALMGLWGVDPVYHVRLGIYAPGRSLAVASSSGKGQPFTLVYTMIDPDGVRENSVFEMKPVKVVPTSFSGPDEITYLTRLHGMLQCHHYPGQERPEVAAVLLDIKRRVRQLPCDMAPTTAISGQIVADYAAMLDHGNGLALATLEGEDASVNWNTTQTADVVCQAGRKSP